VTVSVKNPSGYQFSVVGKVKTPGTFTPGRYVNALEAISIAGGPTEFAQLGGVTILRKVGQQLQTMRVRVGDALRGDASRLNATEVPLIQSGDTVVMP
jgi:polysaccharide export outer membrane protein